MLSGRTTWKWQLLGAVTAIVALAIGGGVWLFAELGEGERDTAAASDGKIARIEPRGGATVYVAPGATVRLDLDAYDGTGAAITPTTQLIAWLVVVPGQEPAREAWKAMLNEAWNADTSPSAPLANIAGTRTAANYTAPSLDSYIGTTVTVRAVVAKADCASGGSSTIALYPPADWNGPCAADFTITIGTAPTETPTTTPETVTPTPTPETDPPGEAETHALTLTQSTGGRLAATPAGPYQEGATVTVTATPDSGYRLTAWGGDCAGQAAGGPCTLTMNGDKTASATFAARTAQPPAPTLITVDVGDRGVVLLEWTPGTVTDGVTGWQYRWQRLGYEDELRPKANAWSAWTAIPGSTAATRSYRATGLALRAHFFEVRAVAGTVAGDGSGAVMGLPPIVGADGIPHMTRGQISEGGRAWRLSASELVIDIPAGTRLVLEGGGLQAGIVTVSIRDVASGTWQVVDLDNAAGEGRGVDPELAQPDQAGGVNASQRDVNAIFDAILASMRVVKP